MAEKASKKARIGNINWINAGIGIFQIILGIWFIILAVN